RADRADIRNKTESHFAWRSEVWREARRRSKYIGAGRHWKRRRRRDLKEEGGGTCNQRQEGRGGLGREQQQPGWTRRSGREGYEEAGDNKARLLDERDGK